MNIDKQIEVMAAFRDGAKIEQIAIDSSAWKSVDKPEFMWGLYDYRIAQLTFPPTHDGSPVHNPAGLTPEEVPEGRRLLTEKEWEYLDEKRPLLGGIACWLKNSWGSECYIGNSINLTYSVPIDWRIPKPEWRLLEPPTNKQWHRTDWTEDMLPEGWRPLLLNEKDHASDEELRDGVWTTVSCLYNHRWHTGQSERHTRTRRPLPTTKRLPLTAADVPIGSAFRPNGAPAGVYITPSVLAKCISYCDSTLVCHRTWAELLEGKWQIKRPDEDWCDASKEAE